MIPDFTNSQSLNRYAYVLNNPIKLIDPTGHKCVGKDEECEGENGKSGHGFGVKAPKPKKKGTGSCSGASYRGIQTLRASGPSIGTPQNLGEHLSGVWVGGGSPNHFGVMGFIPEQEGDQVYWAGVNAGLGYNSTYSVDFYKNGAQIHLTESYSLQENTQFTEVESAGSILNIKTSDGTKGNVSLGEFDVTNGKVVNRSTTITIYGSYPEEMNISIMISTTTTFRITTTF